MFNFRLAVVVAVIVVSSGLVFANSNIETFRPLRYAHVTGRADGYTRRALLRLAAELAHVSSNKLPELFRR